MTSGEVEDDDEDELEEVFLTNVVLPYGYELSGWVLGKILYWLSVTHAVLSLGLVFAFYQLKV